MASSSVEHSLWFFREIARKFPKNKRREKSLVIYNPLQLYENIIEIIITWWNFFHQKNHSWKFCCWSLKSLVNRTSIKNPAYIFFACDLWLVVRISPSELLLSIIYYSIASWKKKLVKLLERIWTINWFFITTILLAFMFHFDWKNKIMTLHGFVYHSSICGLHCSKKSQRQIWILTYLVLDFIEFLRNWVG